MYRYLTATSQFFVLFGFILFVRYFLLPPPVPRWSPSPLLWWTSYKVDCWWPLKTTTQQPTTIMSRSTSTWMTFRNNDQTNNAIQRCETSTIAVMNRSLSPNLSQCPSTVTITTTSQVWSRNPQQRTRPSSKQAQDIIPSRRNQCRSLPATSRVVSANAIVPRTHLISSSNVTFRDVHLHFTRNERWYGIYGWNISSIRMAMK